MRTGKLAKTMALGVLGLALALPAVLTAQTPEQRGQALFQNPKAFGGQTSCSACHPGGRGLEQAAAKTSFRIMGQRQNNLAEAVNFCIINANRGQAIAEDSEEMRAIIAYLKTLGAKAPAPAYGPPPPAPGPGYGRPAPTPGYGVRPPSPGPGYGR